MPRFSLDEYTPNVFPGMNDGTDPWCTVRKESGDAQLRLSNPSDYLKSVTEQKQEFSKYIRSRRSKAKADIRKRTSSDLSDGVDNVLVTDSINAKVFPVDGKEGWLDEFLNSQPCMHEDFYTILHTKAPNLEETNSLLDQVLELRSDLEDRVTELRGLGQEMRKMSQVMKLDPFASKPKLENKTSVAKVISSVRTMQNLCAEMETHSSQNVF